MDTEVHFSKLMHEYSVSFVNELVVFSKSLVHRRCTTRVVYDTMHMSIYNSKMHNADITTVQLFENSPESPNRV